MAALRFLFWRGLLRWSEEPEDEPEDSAAASDCSPSPSDSELDDVSPSDDSPEDLQVAETSLSLSDAILEKGKRACMHSLRCLDVRDCGIGGVCTPCLLLALLLLPLLERC